MIYERALFWWKIVSGRPFSKGSTLDRRGHHCIDHWVINITLVRKGLCVPWLKGTGYHSLCLIRVIIFALEGVCHVTTLVKFYHSPARLHASTSLSSVSEMIQYLQQNVMYYQPMVSHAVLAWQHCRWNPQCFVVKGNTQMVLLDCRFACEGD